MTRVFPAVLLLTALCAGAIAVCAEEIPPKPPPEPAGGAAAEALQPALEAEPASDGSLTWWLHTPTLKDAFETAKPPKDAREGAPIAEGSEQKWALGISPMPFVDLRQQMTGRSGMAWASVRINSQTGGFRRLRGYSYCALRIYRDGQLVLEKAQPAAPFANEADAEIELPKGVSEFVVGVMLRSGFCGFQASLVESRAKGVNKPAAGDRILVPTLAGRKPDSNAAALAALRFESKDMFVNPGRTTMLAVTLHGSRPVGLGPLTCRFLSPNGLVIGKPQPPLTTEQLARSVFRAEYAIPENIDFTHEISMELSADKKEVGTRKITLYSLRGLSQAAQAQERDIQERAAKCGHALPNAALAIEKLKLFIAKIESGEERVTLDLGTSLLGMLSSSKTFAEKEEAGKDPFEGKTGYFERAYQSRIDESPQPYFVHVPASYASEEAQKKRHPLVVFLHGYVPGYDKHRWWEEMPEFNAVFERNNCFLLIPFGRSNADFQASGEVDVLDAIAEAKRLYPIDDDRVYLYGYSMGGMGVYTIGAHYADQFAAGIVFSGRADSPLQNLKPMQQFHAFKQRLMHADNPISLCENFLSLPLRIYHGKDDFIINVREANRMEERFGALNCNAKLTVMPGDHFFGFDVMGTDEPVTWLLQQKRNLHEPKKGGIKAYSLRYAKFGGFQITATAGGVEPLELEWNGIEMDGSPVITKQSKNILQTNIRGNLEPKAVEGRHKTPQLCGPIREATCGPFMIVYGTSGTPDANAYTKKCAEQFAQEWFVFGKSRALVKADKDVTDAEKQSKNLFLFGEQQDNLLHAAAAKDLPISVKDGQVKIGSETLPLAGKGITYIFPSPFSPNESRSVVICAGLPYGHDVAPNHKLDLLPDFLLFEEQKDTDSTDTSKPLCAGFFDGAWKLDPNTTWWFNK